MRTELNSASETASHAVSARAKIKNLGQLQKRISQESLSKAAKKPVLFKNKVDKFLHDYSIQQQDVLDIERLLPVLQSMASAPSSTPQSQPFMSSTAKLEKTAGSNYAAKLTSMEPRRSAHTGQLSATATMMSKQLPTIEEDGVEAPKFEVNDDGTICQTVDRQLLWHALTPQLFPAGQLAQNLRSGLASGALITDEASAMELAGVSPGIVTGRTDNIKVTHPDDLGLAGLFLNAIEQQSS